VPSPARPVYLAFAVLALALAGCDAPDDQSAQNDPTPTAAPRFDPGAASTALRDGMTMKEVEDAVGYRPSETGQMTCGAATPDPWPCRLWTFQSGFESLQVTFQNDAGVWHVNSWSVY
jgi:hypothetical protein